MFLLFYLFLRIVERLEDILWIYRLFPVRIHEHSREVRPPHILIFPPSFIAIEHLVELAWLQPLELSRMQTDFIRHRFGIFDPLCERLYLLFVVAFFAAGFSSGSFKKRPVL